MKISNFGVCLALSLLGCASTTQYVKHEQVEDSYKSKKIPYRSFVRITSESYFKYENCNEVSEEKCKEFPVGIVGSGAFIKRSKKDKKVGYVLTAKHVCDHAKEYEISDAAAEALGIDKSIPLHRISQSFSVKDYWGVEHHATHFFSVDKESVDACVLKVTTMPDNVQSTKIANQKPFPGEQVFNIAAPRGIHIIQGGLMFSGYYSGEEKNIAVYTISSAGGSSGSPIFNMSSELVGMIWGYPLIGNKRVIEQLSFSIKLEHIHEIINSLDTVDDIL